MTEEIGSPSRIGALPQGGLRRPAAGLLPLSDAATEVLTAIRSADGRPYLVGGCVRDALLAPGRRPEDVDIEVFGLELGDLVRALERVGRVDEVGRSFRVLKVRHGDETLDVSLPRARAAGHTVGILGVDDHMPLREAASRRDYTINALMFDPAEDVVLDFVGGLSDLRDGVLRHSGPAFVEDPL